MRAGGRRVESPTDEGNRGSRADAWGEPVTGGSHAGGRADACEGAGPAGGSGLILLAICPAAFIAVLNSYALGPFLPRVASELGTSVALLGQVPALLNAAAAVLGLAMGPLADRFGNRLMLLAGTAAAAAGALATWLAPTFELLLLAALFGALARAVVAPVALAIVGARLAGLARMRALSYVVAALSGSAILGIPALTTIAALADTWRAAFGALGAAALLTLLPATLLLIGGLMPLAALGFTAALVAPVGPVAAIGLAACGTMLLGIVEATSMTLLTSASPAGRATTMTANQSANSLGTAVGGGVGGLLLATGGYQALGLGIPVFAAAAVLVLWASRPRAEDTRP